MKFFVCLLVLICSLSLSNASLVKSKAYPRLTQSHSSIPLPYLYDSNVAANIAYGFLSGAYSVEYVGDFVIVGYEHSTPFFDQLFPAVIVYRVVDDYIVEVDRLSASIGESTAAVSISGVAERPFIVRSSRIGNAYLVSLYTWDTTTGMIDHTPKAVVDMSTVNPDFWNTLLTYHGCVGFSDDAKYITYTSTVSSDGVNPTDQLLGFFEVSADGTSITNVGSVAAPSAAGGVLYPQPEVIMRLDVSGDFYHVIAAFDYIVPGNPYAATFDSQLVSYRYVVADNSLLQTGQMPVPQFSQGYDLSPDMKKLIVVTNSVSTYGSSLSQLPTQPYINNSSDPYSEFRYYSYNKYATTSALAFIDSTSTDLFGLEVSWSHNGKYIAVSGSVHPIVYAPLPSPLSGFAPSTGNSLVVIYKLVGNDFDEQGIAPASPFTLLLGWSSDDSHLIAVGQPNLLDKDVLFFKVEKTN